MRPKILMTICLPTSFLVPSCESWCFVTIDSIHPRIFEASVASLSFTLCISYLRLPCHLDLNSKKLSLVQCAGFHHLGLQFTHDNKNLIKFELQRAEILEMSYVILHGEDEISSMKECIDLYRFLSSTPNLATLVLDKVSLNFMDPRRSILMENMKTLVLYGVDFNDLQQISKLLNLIRSSPNLQTLKISVAPQAKKKDLKVVRYFVSPECNLVDVWRQLKAKKKDLKVERYLASPECRKIVLSQLRSVEIGKAAGTLAEFLSIYLLRASSPSPPSLRLRWHSSPVFGPDVEELQ